MKLLELLTVLTYENTPKGTAYIRAHMNEGNYKQELDAFWRYFSTTFMKKTTRYDDPSSGLSTCLHLGTYPTYSMNVVA